MVHEQKAILKKGFRVNTSFNTFEQTNCKEKTSISYRSRAGLLFYNPRLFIFLTINLYTTSIMCAYAH